VGWITPARGLLLAHGVTALKSCLAFAFPLAVLWPHGLFAQVPAGGEVQIDSWSADSEHRPQVAVEPDGDFVVVWESRGQDGSGLGLFGRRFDAAGAPRGSEFPINSYTTGDQWESDVAIERNGTFIVVWRSVQNGGPESRIVGRRFDGSGSPLGPEFIVNSSTTGSHIVPAVGFAADGRFVVAWAVRHGVAESVAARRFDRHGNPTGADLLVAIAGMQRYTDVAVTADGAFVVVWDGSGDGSGRGILARRYDAGGSPLGPQFIVNTYTSGYQNYPSVDASPTGGFIVAWSGHTPNDASDWGVSAQRFDEAGNPLGGEAQVNTETLSYQYFHQTDAVSHDAAGNFVITWTSYDGSSWGAFGQRFDAAGARRGSEFRINVTTADTQNFVSVGADPVGNFVATWDSYQDPDGIYVRRFGGLAPDALFVDTAGNGVLEPGESIDIRPSWRNTNGAAQTFAASLTSISGPAGATHTIVDGIGDYGTVPNGVSAPCGDCYQVAVSDPPVRPALHWDASVTEAIVPDAQGQRKTWSLHVGRSFADVTAASAFYRFVETLLHHGVTGGCTASTYCPGATTTRAQMAAFALVANDGPSRTPPACGGIPMFADVPASSPFCPWVEELARRGAIGGCGGGNYCPDAPVSRDQLAVFVLRTADPALAPPACAPPNLFGDVPETSPFCAWIEELARRGVVSGCGSGNYCPTSPVTREQMAVFISAGFGLQLYGP
jgi:S-layer family protein